MKMVAMNKPARADYGVDAPIAVRNLLIVCALGIISLITRAAGVWGKESGFALLGRPLISSGLACGAMAAWMIWSSKFGKVREREAYLDLLAWREPSVFRVPADFWTRTVSRRDRSADGLVIADMSG